MKSYYTKAKLEDIIYAQLENLDAMGELVMNLKKQNFLLRETNQKLHDELFNAKSLPYPTRVKSRKPKNG